MKIKYDAYPNGHYSHPTPSLEDLNSPMTIPNMGIHIGDLKHVVARHYGTVKFPTHKQPGYYYYYENDFYSYNDAITLSAMILENRPRKIVEVGSGLSTAVMCDTRDHAKLDELEIIAIDPNPERLNSLGLQGVQIIPQKVQDIQLDIFRSLRAGDMLFIDGSHVSKYNSDLNYVMFNILPELPIGVLVHFHDVFPNFEYPKVWVEQGKFWNEAYMLRAFLTGNMYWCIDHWNHVSVDDDEDFYAKKAPDCLKNRGGSIYLRSV